MMEYSIFVLPSKKVVWRGGKESFPHLNPTATPGLFPLPHIHERRFDASRDMEGKVNPKWGEILATRKWESNFPVRWKSNMNRMIFSYICRLAVYILCWTFNCVRDWSYSANMGSARAGSTSHTIYMFNRVYSFIEGKNLISLDPFMDSPSTFPFSAPPTSSSTARCQRTSRSFWGSSAARRPPTRTGQRSCKTWWLGERAFLTSHIVKLLCESKSLKKIIRVQ